MNRVLLLQRVLGAAYVVAGFAKFVPRVEDVGEVLRTAAAANVGTPLEGLSAALAGHAEAVKLFVAAAMLASGAVQLLDRGLVRAASAGQLLMLFCFSTIIHRSVPGILPVDALFAAAAVVVIVAKTRRRHPAAEAART